MTFPFRCGMIRRYALLEHYGELSARKRETLRRHIVGCKACADYHADLVATLTALVERPGGEPDGSFWSGYWPRLQQRLERESRVPFVHHRRQDTVALRPVHAGIAAVVLLLVGVCIGRLLLPSPDTPSATTEVMSSNSEMSEEQARRLARCLDRTALILTEIVNNGDAYVAARVVPSPTQREVSVQLASEVRGLREQLETTREVQLRQLLWQMEILLEQIAHLERSEIKSGIDMIRDGVEQENILPTIAMTRSMLDRHMLVPGL